MEILLPIGAIVLIVFFVGYLQRGKQKVSCPECNSVQVRIVEQQLKQLKQNQTMGYATKLDVQLIVETAYRCQACQYTWQVTAPEN